ncbi:MAG: epoxyqueuosine reductase QueH [Lachnospiraceae bacterium]|nr:epoxyqueuosine reductase QueH [Lachnospiraceae bacterium]MBF1016502.1 epoxyqueuosine reductase QueH [Lachnospiraceae bacterium]MBF1022630.1 epoxyqueuosine reductase QueH [Lachnospiraceae bacterium]
MNRINYQKQLEEVLKRMKEEGERKRLLLHACCAPCSSYCLEYLREAFALTVFFYNPNLTEQEEYRRRVEEEKRLIALMNGQEGSSQIEILEGRYEPERFLEAAKGLETCKEGGERCVRCFALRLGETARVAAEGGFDFFTTSLTISPLKNSALLNRIGAQEGERYGVRFLPSDFKKNNGYLRSTQLSRLYGLYRQNYCGCIYSKVEASDRRQP